GGPPLSPPMRRPDRGGALRPVRLADLLLGGAQAIFLRPGADLGRTPAGGRAGAGFGFGIGLGFGIVAGTPPPDLDDAPAPGPYRLRRRRRLVLVSAGDGARGGRDVPDRRSGDPQGMDASPRLGGDGPRLGLELRGVLRGLARD